MWSYKQNVAIFNSEHDSTTFTVIIIPEKYFTYIVEPYDFVREPEGMRYIVIIQTELVVKQIPYFRGVMP